MIVKFESLGQDRNLSMLKDLQALQNYRTIPASIYADIEIAYRTLVDVYFKEEKISMLTSDDRDLLLTVIKTLELIVYYSN